MVGPRERKGFGRSVLVSEAAFYLSAIFVGGVLDVIARLVYDNFIR